MLGSNINKEINLPNAIETLRASPHIDVEAVSPTYETAPVRDDGQLGDQPTFYNAAVLLHTPLPATDLHTTLRNIEYDLGRARVVDKFAARTIDIDIAFYGQESMELAGNSLPDPDIVRYTHLAVPLADIAPTWIHPATGQTLRAVADELVENTETTIFKIDHL